MFSLDSMVLRSNLEQEFENIDGIREIDARYSRKKPSEHVEDREKNLGVISDEVHENEPISRPRSRRRFAVSDQQNNCIPSTSIGTYIYDTIYRKFQRSIRNYEREDVAEVPSPHSEFAGQIRLIELCCNYKYFQSFRLPLPNIVVVKEEGKR